MSQFNISLLESVIFLLNGFESWFKLKKLELEILEMLSLF